MRFFPPRLRFVLIATVTLLTVCAISSVSWFFTTHYKEESLEHLFHYAGTVATNVASAETDYLITETYASLQDSIVSIQKEPHVKSISVIALDGTILADTNPEHLGTTFPLDKRVNSSTSPKYTQVNFDTMLAETLLPIQVGVATIGWCEIVLDIEYIHNSLAAIKQKTIIVTVFVVLILVSLLFLFSSLLTKPLEEIMNATSKVAEGDFDRQARVAGVFEIRRLAEVFNDMTRAIKERESHLRHAQKIEAIGVLSSSIAHEFGNPLMGINFLLKDLQKNSCLTEEEQQLLDLGLAECIRMKILIRDLKYFYRPSSEKKTVIDLHQLIDNVFIFQKKYLQSKSISIVRVYCKHTLMVRVVEDQIKQVLLNLLLNAADSLGDTGGIVTISTSLGKGIVKIAVNDTGTYVSPEDQKKIFMPFFTAKPDVSGTGLGLSVSYGIVKNHQGDIDVSSTPEQGTTFTITLPVVEKSEA
jgi:signal transduction histidine kinase